MYIFQENQEKAFLLIEDLIKYDLNKNKININFNKDYLIKYYKKEIVWNNKIEKEKISSCLNFYNFILNPKTSEPFIKIVDYILLERPWMFSNSPLNNFFESFSDKKISVVFYAVLVLKSLTNPSYYRKSFYENDSDEIVSADNWHDSTNILETQFILIRNFIIYNNLNIILDDHLCLRSLFKFINILIKQNIIKEKNITRRIGIKKKIKTLKYWSILEESNLFDLINETNFSDVPYELIKYNGVLYEKGQHFSKIILVCRKNWYSGEIFNINDKRYIEKILNLKLYLNIDKLKIIRDLILEENNILNENLKDEINKLGIELKSIFNKNLINDEDKFNLKEKQKKINKLIDIERMNKMIKDFEIDEEKYLPTFFDFRGRNYFDDYLSPTFSRYTRLSFFYGYYEEKQVDDMDISLLKPFIKDDIELIINKTLEKFNIIKENYTINCVFWLLIGIGKHFINKEKIKVPLKDFLDKGYEYLDNKIDVKKSKDLKDLIEIKHYESVLINLNNKKKLRKDIILKDCTASVLQNLIKILGPKDQESINLANLGDTYHWYDPYSHILKKFKKSFRDDKNELIYFKRSTVKKTIMTNPYSAGEKTSWDYFIKSVKKENNVKEEEILKLKIIFKSFYEFVTDFFEELNFFKNSSKRIIDYYITLAKKEKKIIMINEDSETNFIYYKHRTHYIDIKEKNEKRITKKIKKIDFNLINYKKIYTSIRANVAHWLDSIFLRKLVNRLENPIFTIHDEFAIDILNVNNLIIYANEIANEDIKIDIPWDKSHNFKIFSIFILV